MWARVHSQLRVIMFHHSSLESFGSQTWNSTERSFLSGNIKKQEKKFFSCAITVQKAFICISRDLNIALQLDGTIVSYYLSLGFYLFGNGIVASSLLISSLPNTYILIILLTGGHLTSSTWYCKEKVFVARPSSSSGSENCNCRSFHFFSFLICNL